MGDQVDVVDNFATGSIDNIKDLEDDPNFTCTVGDVRDIKTMAPLVDHCDMIYHLAAAVGVDYIIDNFLQSLMTNIRGTEVILELANDKKKKVVLASTSEIYGKKNGHVPFREDSDRILGPTTVVRWHYSTSKAVDELFALAYWREKRLPCVIFRPFNVIGPRQSEAAGVVPRFVKNALLGNPISIYGDGEQSRCWTYIDDALDGLVALAMSDQAVGEIFNLGSQFGSTIKELADKIKQMTDSDSTIETIPYDQVWNKGEYEDLIYRVPDLAKIRGIVGYDPKVNLDQALAKIISYYER